MSFNLDRFFLKYGKKVKWVMLNTKVEQMQAMIHVITSALWAASWSHFTKFSAWFYLSIIPWIAYVLWKEFYQDGHLARLKDKTETEDQRKDLISDLFTKHIGLIFYLLGVI